MRRSGGHGPKLPQSLLKQVQGSDNSASGGARSRKRGAVLNQKDRGQHDRPLKKHKSVPRPVFTRKLGGASKQDAVNPAENTVNPRPNISRREREEQGVEEDDTESDAAEDGGEHQTASSNPKPRDKRIEEEEEKISALEKKLGIRGKKRSKPDDYGLDGLLSSDSEAEQNSDHSAQRSGKLLKIDEDYLRRKRRQANSSLQKGSPKHDKVLRNGSPDPIATLDQFSVSDDSDNISAENTEDMSNNEGRDGRSSGLKTSLKSPRIGRENPYLPPGSNSQTSKSVPLASGRSSGQAEVDAQLYRLIKGQLNRLTESNLASILHKIEEIYRDKPRQSVTNSLAGMLRDLISDRASLSDAFILLHAGFSAALFRTIGPEFGAHLLGEIVERFDELYHPQGDGTLDKIPHNLMAFIAQLYNLQVITCDILFDYIRLFLTTISETNTELLLRIVRSCGLSLRQDDPLALKDIVLQLHRKTSEQGSQNVSVRTKFMIETMENLKDNRLKAGVEASTILAEQLTRMKRFLGSLKDTNTARGTEPLKLILADVRNIDKRGKWWLAAAASSTEQDDGAIKIFSHNVANTPGDLELDMGEDFLQSNLKSLSKQYGMNTDIRRAIFATILSATDCENARDSLFKLRLSKSQENDIPLVLVRCAIAEKNAFNPFYSLLAQKLCVSRKMRMGFQFQLWDILKAIDSGHDLFTDEALDDVPEDAAIYQISNLSKMYGYLISRGGLNITVLKTLELPNLSPRVRLFVENLFITVLLGKHGGQEGTQKAMLRLEKAFIPAHKIPTFAMAVRWFLANVVAKSDLVSTKDLKVVKVRCRDAIELLSD